MKKSICLVALAAASIVFGADVALAQDAAAASDGLGPIGKGLAMGLAGLGAALGMGKAAAGGLEAIGRNPSAAGNIQTPMIIGLAFMEVVAVLAFVIALIAI